ncbi:MAG: TIGR02217 family protein [Sphingomonadales bacterium]|nr:MAG: TIGR02217 family protein [Sphingomonadales bacterium]
MAFWLARERRGQESTFMQRFDPRFWTVNFPRPAMASVVTTGPDALRVDVELHHAGELVGLIWESADTLDHPLLAYATDRDYAHTTLSFRWQSDGIIALDEPNGPTLTIEGRDAAGAPRTWYVRLWNYAQGTPTDAQITLPFSTLESGYGLPGEPIYPRDIDRLFISLVAPDYASGSAAPLPTLFEGSVVVSDISTDGARAMIELGDVLVPPHGERIATAYDDAYNQTPARLLRAVTGLGYREDIVHYVGMSHFMRLARQADGSLNATPDGALCTPATRWHDSFFTLAQVAGFEVIASLSYELFDAYCPGSWKQRTASGAPALTGWVPPSTLLSPAQPQAMAWLADVARRFVALLEQAGQPVRFQIGEPWWWVTPAREICLYDVAATSVFGGNPPIIADVTIPLDAAAKALLDQAGELLAQSTATLTAAVRAAAQGPSEVLLLAFTPTILDPATPDLYRANLPTGWAAPAFDRLQLEDYDWLTAGAESARRAAYAFVNDRLGYPLADQDYLAGFVLNPADAELFWTRIDSGIDEAAARGIARRYVWALPQVCRDGYTRLLSAPEQAMDPFDDVLYPFALGRTASVAPEFSTSVALTASGHERRNALWADARLHFDVGPGIRSESELSDLIAFFRARRGPARGFRLMDPFDNSSNGMSGSPTMLDQLIGIGDGLRADFQLVKFYGSGTEPQVRPITRPRRDTLIVSVGGAVRTDWTLHEKGVVRLHSAPPAGAEVRAGFRFDVPVRFAEDRLDISTLNFAAGEAPSVPLIEIRETA